MQCQAELALIRAEVVAHEVGVLLEVDGLRRQGGQPLPPVPVGLGVGGGPARARLGPHAVLEVHHLGGRGGGTRVEQKLDAKFSSVVIVLPLIFSYKLFGRLDREFWKRFWNFFLFVFYIGYEIFSCLSAFERVYEATIRITLSLILFRNFDLLKVIRNKIEYLFQ